MKSPLLSGLKGNAQKRGELWSSKTWVQILIFFLLAVGLTASYKLAFLMWKGRSDDIVKCLEHSASWINGAIIIQLLKDLGKKEKSDSLFCLAPLPFKKILMAARSEARHNM